MKIIRDKMKNHKVHYTILIIVIVLLISFYIGLYLANKELIKKYDNVILPGISINKNDLGNLSYEEATKRLTELEEKILSEKITVTANGKEYTYTIQEMGMNIEIENSIKKIENYQKKLSFSRKIAYANKRRKQNFKAILTLDLSKYNEFFSKLSEDANVMVKDGYFDTSEGVRYVEGEDGFEVEKEENAEIIQKYFQENSEGKNRTIELVGHKIEAEKKEEYKKIDTMTSSFSTKYDAGITLRSQNLRAGLSYIDGSIIEPGEVFSFFQHAGPYNKAGFVFYYMYTGNGVCQVATTVYNAALLGGHEILARSPHKKKSEYVAGGLDATISSSEDGSWNVDMQFKNVYDYPIYIKAYDTYGEIHVEFWSNKEALQGKSYSTESVWLGGRGYRTFRHTYQDGEEIAKEEIATTWYPED